MDKLIQTFQLFTLLTILGIGFSQGLYGQTIVAQEAGQVLYDDIFGGSYEYITGETIVSDQVISGGADVSYKAVHSIKLTKGFKVEKDCRFKAQLVKYSEVVENNGLVENNGAVPKSAERENTPPRSFTVHPNVTNGIFHIGLKGNDGQCDLAIYNTSGILVYTAQDLSPGETAIDLAGFPKGVYLLKANIDNKPYQEKIVLR